MECRGRLEDVTRDPRDLISSVVRRVHRKIHEAIIRVRISDAQLDLPQCIPEAELMTVPRGSAGIAEVAAAATGRNIKGNQLVVHRRGE